MAATQRSSIPAELRSLFPTRWLNSAARESGLVVRRRKVAPAALFWTLVLGFAVGHGRSLASPVLPPGDGVGLVPSSFYDRCLQVHCVWQATCPGGAASPFWAGGSTAGVTEVAVPPALVATAVVGGRGESSGTREPA